MFTNQIYIIHSNQFLQVQTSPATLSPTKLAVKRPEAPCQTSPATLSPTKLAVKRLHVPCALRAPSVVKG